MEREDGVKWRMVGEEGVKWRMVQRDGTGNIYKSIIYIYYVFVCRNIYVISLLFFILALFLTSCGGWKLAPRYSWMYGENRALSGKKFVAYCK